MQILLVDDEPVIAGLLAQVLTMDGHSVNTALDGETALKQMEGGSYDLVMTDLTMPGMDGLSLAKRIKAAHPSQKIILLTGAGSAGMNSPDVDYYLSKPIKPETLNGFIAQLAG